ncbi:MAG: anthranilate synthase component I family protein [Agriterribacter sp.]
MKRTFRSFPVHDFLYTKWQMLSWANQFNICCFLDDHSYNLPGHSFECMLAVNTTASLQTSCGNAYQQLHDFLDNNHDWCFGHLGYDLKNETEAIYSRNPDHIQFPDLFFFVPEVVVILNTTELLIGVEQPQHQQIADAIMKMPVNTEQRSPSVDIKSRFSKAGYIATIEKLKEHIVRGDCYEINFCQEFYNEKVFIDPMHVYKSLSLESPNPFSSFYKLQNKYLLCASPERYLKKTGHTIISQPIKGTLRRDNAAVQSDIMNKAVLRNSAKNRSENVMIVDLVRNDLSKICTEGSVKVDELFGIYSFPQLYQMISTISGELKKDVSLADIFKATFPMGSMTGAPKKRVMELIEKYEQTKRGLFSGAIGYISPEKDMDFNVVIRSVLYNAGTGYLSFQTGSAITYNSNPEEEYDECMLKAAAIKKVLNY